MMIFREIRPDANHEPAVYEAGRMWLQDGHLHVSGLPKIVKLAQHPLELTFGGSVDPATEPQKFLDFLPDRFHGTYFWVEQAPDDTPPELNIPEAYRSSRQSAVLWEEPGDVKASLDVQAHNAAAGNAAQQLSRDDGLTSSDLAAKSPAFHEGFRKLMAEADADFADEDAAIARGDLVLTPDGRLLPAGDPALVPGYMPARPPTVAFITHTRGAMLSLAVYPDHEKLVGCDGSRGIQVWDLRSGQELCRRENVSSPIDQLAVSPDGLRVVGIARGGSVFAWDAQSLMPIVEAAQLECYATLLGRETKVRKQYFSVFTKSGVEIYEDGGKVCAKWPNQGPVVVLLDEREPECIQLAISDDGLYTAIMATHAPESYVYVFETEHLLCAPEWADPDDADPEAINSWGDDGDVQDMVFSPDGQTLAVKWSEGNWVDIWDFRKGKTDSYGAYTHVPITAFAFLGNKKVVVGRGNEIEVLDLDLHAVET